MLKSLFLIPIIFTIIFNNCNENNIKNSVTNNIVCIEGLNGCLNLYNWKFSNDPKLIGKVKTIIKETDQTGIIKASIDDIGVQFFLLENELGTPTEFNTNINLVVQDISNYKGIKNINDFINTSKNEFPIVLNNAIITDTIFRNINGYQCGIIEANYDQKVGFKTFSLSLISMSILKDNKAYIFSGVALQREINLKKPIIEKILFSLKEKNKQCQSYMPESPIH
jgi:hypothetical protein